jgi:predicted nucleotidyltransferase
MNVKDHMPQAYARRLAQKVSALLKKRYGAKRVLLIGALTLGCYNPDFSEIDVLFEGVKDSDVAEAIDDCRRTFGQRDSSGIKRVDYLVAQSVPDLSRRLSMHQAEEI